MEDAPAALTVNCGLCGFPAARIFDGHSGYIAPSTFDIYNCPNCETRFAFPMESDGKIYDLIYNNASKIPGYERYERYRRGLKSASSPLSYLAEQEDIYWSIAEALRQIGMRPAHKANQRILEIGSGFGYLTYALNRAGYACYGIDISVEGVASARRDFGDFYEAKDLMEMTSDEGRFDLIIATELIEHVVNPSAIIEKAKKLLKPGGRILLTTPNKDLYSDRFVWHSDLPPVHLWWFSKTSLRRIGWQLGLSVTFVDFSKFYGRHIKPLYRSTKPQTFDEHGSVKFKDSLFNALARTLVARYPRIFMTMAKIFICKQIFGKAFSERYRDSLSLCVVMEAFDFSSSTKTLR